MPKSWSGRLILEPIFTQSFQQSNYKDFSVQNFVVTLSQKVDDFFHLESDLGFAVQGHTETDKSLPKRVLENLPRTKNGLLR